MTALRTVLLLLAAVLIGCSAPPAADPLSGTGWVLVSLDGAAPLPQATIRLRFANGTARGNMGCNELDGPYRIDGSMLRLHEVAQSAMLCSDEAVMRQEAAFAAALRLTETFVFQPGQSLELQDATGKTRLVFQPL